VRDEAIFPLAFLIKISFSRIATMVIGGVVLLAGKKK